MVGVAFSDDRNEFEKMLTSQYHFPWHKIERCDNISIGLVRLNSLEDFKFEDEKYSIILDGYIYNFKLDQIPKMFREKGEKIFEVFEGEFVLLFYDKEKNILFIINDPFGLRRCYYSIFQNRLLISTETKAIANIIKPKFDEKTVYGMIRFRRVFSDRTIFEEIRRLMPGNIIKYDRNTNRIETKSYYQYQYKPENRSEEEIAKEVATLFKKALDKRIKGNKKTAIALSGGLDSRSMTILAKSKNISTFTYGSGNDPDSKIGPKIAKSLNIPHTSITFDCRDEGIANLAELSSYLTEGLTTLAFCFHIFVFSKIYKKFDEYFWTFEFDDFFGGNLISAAWDQKNYEKLSAKELMKHRSIFSKEECEQLFLIKDHTNELIDEHFQYVTSEETLPAFEYAQLLDLLQRGTTGHFITRNFIEERIPTFDRELIDFVQKIPLELKVDHRVYYKFLNYIDPELAKIRSATTGLRYNSSKLEKIIVRNKARLEKFKEICFKKDINEKNYFDVDIAMRAKPWIAKIKEHVFSSNIVKQYINTDFVGKLLLEHTNKKANNGTKLFSILTMAMALNIFSGEKSEADSKKFVLDHLLN